MKNISKIIVEVCQKLNIPYTSKYDISIDDIKELERITIKLEKLYDTLIDIESRHEQLAEFKCLTEQILIELTNITKELNDDMNLLRKK